MSTILTTDILQDDLAVSVARMLAAANKRAREAGVDVARSVITISQSLSMVCAGASITGQKITLDGVAAT